MIMHYRYYTFVHVHTLIKVAICIIFFFLQLLKTLFVSDLVILYNCASTVGIDAYYHTHSFITLLNPFLKASDSSMRIHAKLILAYVSSILTDEEIEESMCLAPSDAIELLSTLGEASTSTNRKAGGFAVMELARGLLQLLVCHENLNLIAKKSILPSVISVVSCGSASEQRAILWLLWSLLKNLEFKDAVLESEFPLSELLEQLKDSDDSSLQMLASCILLELTDSYTHGKHITLL